MATIKIPTTKLIKINQSLNSKCMTTEDLLKPRYKVIAPYPKSGFKIGDIWPDVAPDWTTEEQQEQTMNEMAQYPHLFRKLEWWEERNPEDMPEYVKPIKAQQYVFKVDKFLPSITEYFGTDGRRCSDHTKVFLPSTQSEYTQYINSNP